MLAHQRGIATGRCSKAPTHPSYMQMLLLPNRALRKPRRPIDTGLRDMPSRRFPSSSRTMSRQCNAACKLPRSPSPVSICQRSMLSNRSSKKVCARAWLSTPAIVGQPNHGSRTTSPTSVLRTALRKMICCGLASRQKFQQHKTSALSRCWMISSVVMKIPTLASPVIRVRSHQSCGYWATDPSVSARARSSQC